MTDTVGMEVRIRDPILQYEVAHIFEDTHGGPRRIAYAPDRSSAERYCIQRMKEGRPYTWYCMYYWTEHRYDPDQGVVAIRDIPSEINVLEV